MAPFNSLLEETLEGWSDVRQGLIEEVDNIPEDRFDFRPTEDVRSVRELIQHILEVALMMTAELTRPDADFTRAPFPQLIEPHTARAKEAETKADLLALLESSFDEGRRKFEEAGELAMLQLVKQFNGELGTRFAWLHHGIAQEMYHRGQLTTYERLMGIEPALTRRIRGGGE